MVVDAYGESKQQQHEQRWQKKKGLISNANVKWRNVLCMYDHVAEFVRIEVITETAVKGDQENKNTHNAFVNNVISHLSSSLKWGVFFFLECLGAFCFILNLSLSADNNMIIVV